MSNCTSKKTPRVLLKFLTSIAMMWIVEGIKRMHYKKRGLLTNYDHQRKSKITHITMHMNIPRCNEYKNSLFIRNCP